MGPSSCGNYRGDYWRRIIVLVRPAISSGNSEILAAKSVSTIHCPEIFVAQYGAASVFLARFTAVVRAFVPLIAGILRMSPRQFYAANILSALIWAPAHIFPGVLVAMALRLTGASAEQRTIVLIAALIVATFIIFATRSYFKVK